MKTPSYVGKKSRLSNNSKDKKLPTPSYRRKTTGISGSVNEHATAVQEVNSETKSNDSVEMPPVGYVENSLERMERVAKQEKRRKKKYMLKPGVQDLLDKLDGIIDDKNNQFYE